MAAAIVYLDHQHAKIFRLGVGKADASQLNRREIKHHQSAETDKHKNADKFFHEVALELKDASEILVIGHGTAKQEFVHHLQNHHHENLAKKVVGTETVDHPTDNQLLALGRKFFKTWDAFH